MEMTREQAKQLASIIKQVREGGATPLYDEQVTKMKAIYKELHAHIQQMSAIIDANPVTLSLFEFALTLDTRSADKEDSCLIVGEKTQVRKGLLDMVNRVNNSNDGEDDD